MKSDRKKRFISVLPSVISVLIGLLCGWYLMFITKPADSLGGLVMIFAGGLTDGLPGIGNWLYTATPIILTGMSVAFSIKTGLFNIGASGQFTVGGLAAILAACKLTGLPPVMITVIAIMAGVLAGALWGTIAGVLKAYCSVNEIISGIMLNYVGMLLSNMLIKAFAYNSTFNRSADIPKQVMLGDSLLGRILPGSRISIIFVIAVIIVLMIKFLLDKTMIGYEFRMIGRNRFAGIYAGIDDKKTVVLTMAICGALSGLGGTLIFLSSFGDHILVVENLLQQGFTGISVALLGMSNPLGVIAAGLFIAHITVGGNNLQLYSFTPDVVNMIIAIIVFCGALVIPVRTIIDNIIKDREKKKNSDGQLSGAGKEAET